MAWRLLHCLRNGCASGPSVNEPIGPTVNKPMRLRSARIAILALLCATCASVAAESALKISNATDAAQAGMVDMQSLVPDFRVDMRYAGTNNFVGTRITGYEAPRCYLLRPVAEALQRVERRLRQQHLRLQTFDCYRPVRAVQHFVRWAGDLADQRTKARFYPRLDKRVLLGEYIASTSGHSRGATLDLTMLECDAADRNCKPLDMGTDFDFFDVRAHTDAPDITPLQQRNRQRLREAMQREGFENYAQEWWHYTLQPEPTPGVAYDFVVTAPTRHRSNSDS